MHLSLNNSLGKWILPKEPSPFSPEATNYFSRLDAAGDTTYVDYKQPLANYIDSLVTLGGAYWDDMGSAASFVGVGIQGVTVPLKSTMPTLTNNNFVVGDLDQLTGLKGDASTKYIDTNVADNINGSTDISAGIYVTEGSELEFDAYFGSSENGTGENKTLLSNGYATSIRVFSDVGDNTPSALDAPTGLISSSRGTSASVDYRADGISGTITRTGETPQGGDMYFFATNNSGPAIRHSDIRAAAMHFSTAMSSAELATLEGLQATLLSEIRTAHTFVAAASYFSRLAAAGDTTHVAYKQPLTNYITSLVELGGAYWDNMKSSASFVGVGIQGITVPLRDGMTVPTNNNFVAGDLNQLTGLKGDASTKYFGLNILGSVVEQDNASISVYITEADGAFGFHMGHQGNRLTLRNNPYVELNGAAAAPTNGKPTSKIFGGSRTTSTDVDVRNNQVTSTISNTSLSPSASTMFLFARVTSASSKARLATYHIGSALDLATLEGLQDTLITEIAAI